jgi:ribose 5-phosphate isomerase B
MLCAAVPGRIAIGSDHAGFELKESIEQLITGLGYEVEDLGADNGDSVDYPDFARAVGDAVTSGRAQQGVLVCGTGIGMSIAANKVPGVRAALVWNEETARLSREHNDANILVLGARVTPADVIPGIVEAFLRTDFAGGRHKNRVDKIAELEARRDQ